MGRFAILVIWILLFFFAPFAWADFYTWVDRDGKECYTNDPAKIPHEYRAQSKAVVVRDERVSVDEKPLAKDKTPVAVKEHKDKYGRGEEWWRKRAANLRMQLRDFQDEYDLVLKQEQEQKEKKVIGRKKKSTSNIEKKKAQLEKKIAKTRRMLEVELPEEARKADAYPGWIRE